MHISLIGMSGSGKSYWSERLQKENGFRRFCCDEIIRHKLNIQLSDTRLSSLEDVSRWMDLPYSEGFTERQDMYLRAEKEVMLEIFEYVRQFAANENVVIDTTGSVVYLGNTICSQLKQATRVVYLFCPPEYEEQMFEQFLKQPKPVAWINNYRPLEGEDTRATLERCYPKLLQSRRELYFRYADTRISREILLQENFNTNSFLDLIKNDEVL